MRKTLKTIGMLFVIALILSGCSSEKYGAGVSPDAKKVMVKDIIINPSLIGQTVNLEGIITTQCLSNGCWFFLNDGTGQIFINMTPKGFAITTAKIGKKAKVTGMVLQGENGMELIAYGVEVK